MRSSFNPTRSERVWSSRGLFESGEASVILEHHLSLRRAGTQVICAVVTFMHAHHSPIHRWFNAALVPPNVHWVPASTIRLRHRCTTWTSRFHGVPESGAKFLAWRSGSSM